MQKPYYTDGKRSLYLCDCRELMNHLPVFDLCLTDPPYGIGHDEILADKNDKQYVEFGWSQHRKTQWDNQRPDKSTFDLILRRSAHQIIWGGNYFADLLPPRMGWIVWNKGQRGFSLADGELAWTSFESALRIADISRASALADVKQHPTQKPLQLMTFCIAYAIRNGECKNPTILDPFCGSGTALRVAKDLDLNAVGIEIDEKYCEIAAKRLQQEAFTFEEVNP